MGGLVAAKSRQLPFLFRQVKFRGVLTQHGHGRLHQTGEIGVAQIP